MLAGGGGAAVVVETREMLEVEEVDATGARTGVDEISRDEVGASVGVADVVIIGELGASAAGATSGVRVSMLIKLPLSSTQ